MLVSSVGRLTVMSLLLNDILLQFDVKKNPSQWFGLCIYCACVRRSRSDKTTPAADLCQFGTKSVYPLQRNCAAVWQPLPRFEWDVSQEINVIPVGQHMK